MFAYRLVHDGGTREGASHRLGLEASHLPAQSSLQFAPGQIQPTRQQPTTTHHNPPQPTTTHHNPPTIEDRTTDTVLRFTEIEDHT